jgi:hypothetical protein
MTALSRDDLWMRSRVRTSSNQTTFLQLTRARCTIADRRARARKCDVERDRTLASRKVTRDRIAYAIARSLGESAIELSEGARELRADARSLGASFSNA